MKRILSAIIVLTLVLSLMPLSVFAATDAIIYTEASASKVYPGDTFTYSIFLSGTYDGYSLEFSKEQSGLTVTAVIGESGVNADDLGTSWRLSVLGALSKVDSAKTKIATVTVSVDANAVTGTKEIGFTNIAVSNDIGDRATYATELASVIVISKLTGAQTVSVTPPVKGATPQSTISAGIGYTGAISWEGNPSKFAANKIYSANISLTATNGYVFDSNATGTVDGGNVTDGSVSGDGSTLSFKVTFPKTADKDAPTCIAPTGLTATYGQKLSDITLSNPMGNTDGIWTWAVPATLVGNVGNKSFKATFTPTNTDDYAIVENIDISVTVNPKPITVTIANIADQQYTGNQIKPTVIVTGDNKTLVFNTDYTVEYGTNKNVGTNVGSVTVKAKSGSNYTFSDTTKNFNIVAQAGTVTISGNLNITYPNTVPDVTIDKHGSDGNVTVYYYTNEDCTTGKTSAKPTDAGSYWVKAEMTAGTNHGSAVSNVIAFTIERASITPWVNILGWTYDDNANEPTVNGNTDNGNVTIEYKPKNANNSSYSTKVPTNAGTYTVRATIAATTNYKSAVTSMDFEISPKDISNVSIAVINDQVYSGSAITPQPGVMAGSKNLILNTDFTYGYENNTNVGTTAIVKVIGKGNYFGTTSKNFTIIRKDLSITVSITGWTVGGTPNAPTVIGNLGNGAVTYQFKVKGASDSTYSTTVPTAVGNYTVKATVEQTANYNGAYATADFAISTKAAQTITANNITVNYGDSGKAVSGTTNGNGDITYAVKAGSEFVEVNSTTGVLTIKKAGTATITITASETASHAIATKDITVTVNPQKIAIPTADTTVYTYNGTEQTYKISENNAYTVIGNKQVAANETGYTVTVTLKDTANYQWSDGSVEARNYTFIIKKATITITANDKVANVGDKIPALGDGDYTVSGLVDGETLKTNPSVSYEVTPDMSKAGTTKILVDNAVAPDGGNYNDIVYISGTLTIAKDTDEYEWLWYYLMVLHNRKFDIAATASVGGEIDPAGVSKVQYSKSITYTITPDVGYAIKSVLVDGKDIGSVSEYTFKNVTKKHTISVVFEKMEWQNPFVDVCENNWFYDDVKFVNEEGLMIGTDLVNGKFSPYETLNRATIVTTLWRLAGSPIVELDTDFTDLPDDWYTAAMKWAISEGIILGYGDGTCRPMTEITHEQVIAILHRFMVSRGYEDKPTTLSTQCTYSEWAENDVLWAIANNLFDGFGSDISDLTGTANRAEIAAYLRRLCELIEE